MRRIHTMIAALAIGGTLPAAAAAGTTDMVKLGEKIFMTKKLGNCLACHAVNGKEVDGPGSLGPKLQYLSAWPDQALYDKIYDPYTTNPISAMPPFGKNGWLDDQQIQALVAYLKTIN